MAVFPGVVKPPIHSTPATILVAAAISTLSHGCRKKTTSKKDPCQRLVEQKLRCLGHEDRPVYGKEKRKALEKQLESRAAVARCRRWKRHHPDLFARLVKCLDKSDCQAFESCFQDLFTLYQARRDVESLDNKPAETADPRNLPLPCRDTYTRGRLRAIGTDEALKLARRIEHHCVERSSAALGAAGRQLDRMVKVGSLTGLTDLCGLVRQMASPKSKAAHRPDLPLPEKLKKRASDLNNLCKNRHHIQRVLNRLGRIDRLLSRGKVHLLLKTCRKYKRLADRIVQLGEPALRSLADRLIRACRHDVPIAWLVQRMTLRRRPGKITCALSSRMADGLEDHFPHDPEVHITVALTRFRCARHAPPRRRR